MTTLHDLDDIRWLTGDEGTAALREAETLSGELTARLSRLRRSLSPSRAALVLEQLDLRARAHDKFTRADEMFFTRIGLEQATDEIVADYKARRFANRGPVFDLCCGIGGDLLSLARGSSVVGVDRDEVSAYFARANAQSLNLTDVSFRATDVETINLGECAAWHLDPDRRPAGRRTTRVELHEPSSEAIERMLATNPHAAVKLAPAAEWPVAWNERAEWEWISRGRQCRQLVAWFGNLTSGHGLRRATLLSSAGQPHSFAGPPGDDLPIAPCVDHFVFEPDPAVLAANLTAALAEVHGLAALAPGVAYWTGPAAVSEPLLSAFEVVACLPLDLKRLKAELVARDAGPLEIKIRGIKEDPSKLRQRLALTGSQPLVLLLCRIESRVTAIIARRVAQDR